VRSIVAAAGESSAAHDGEEHINVESRQSEAAADEARTSVMLDGIEVFACLKAMIASLPLELTWWRPVAQGVAGQATAG